MSGPVRAGHVPPFACEAGAPHPSDDYWEQDSHRDVYTPPGGARGGRATGLLAPLVTGWKSRLQKLSEEMHVEATSGPAAEREREIFYEIDAAQARVRQVMVVPASPLHLRHHR